VRPAGGADPLTAEQREQVEALLRRRTVEKRLYLRGRTLLMATALSPGIL
jgi:hypothetical protein